MRRKRLGDRLRSQRGQGMTEYGLIMSAVVASALAVVALLHW